MVGLFRSLIKDERGATAIEYALLASLIAVATIAALQAVSTQLNTVFSEVSTALK
jgi:pilus assembly protein Flp/PilA